MTSHTASEFIDVCVIVTLSEEIEGAIGVCMTNLALKDAAMPDILGGEGDRSV